MALTHRIAGGKRTTGLVLVALGWLFAPTSHVFACSHPTIVSFASIEFGEQSDQQTTPLIHKPAKPAAAPHNPFEPLGPCQGPQCDGAPARPDRPLTSPSTTKVRDTWSLALTATFGDESIPLTGAWLQSDSASPVQFHDAIFHPPRA